MQLFLVILRCANSSFAENWSIGCCQVKVMEFTIAYTAAFYAHAHKFLLSVECFFVVLP